MHNLGTVFEFEVLRTLKKKSFWVFSLVFPIGIAAIIAVVYFSNQATSQASADAAKSKFSIEIMDESGLLSPSLLETAGIKTVSDKSAAVDDVKNGRVDSFVYYPNDITRSEIEVYAKDVGIFDNSRYEAVAKSLVQGAVASSVSPNVATVLSGSTKSSSTIYKDGQVYDPVREMIVPGVFLVLFYLMIATFGGQMLNATVEEKENRVIEMILTTIETRTLIVAKILSLIVLGFTQMIIVLVPVVVGYVLFHDSLSLPGVDLSTLDFNIMRISVGFAVFALSFVMFTGLLVAIGAVMPTAKEASGFMGVVYMLIFAPLYAFGLFISSPDSPFVQFLSYFPLTAPIPLMLRNAVGNLTLGEATISIVILAVSAVFTIWLGVRAFRYGALEYDRRVNILNVLKRNS